MSKIGYIRVSTERQETARQQEIMCDYQVDRIFSEKLSGANTDRPQLRAMLDYVREGDTLYVESISRLGRSTKDLLNPDHKIDLKFMLAEQKERNPRAKFTRAKTLGYFYESQQIRRRIESYKYQMSHRPTARIIRTTAEKFQQSQCLTNWADRENMKAASKALNEMNASNSTLEELESAAHRAFAEFMVMSTPQIELSARIHKMEEQIPAIEKYHEFVAYHKKYTSLEGKAKTKYKSDFCYELDEYHKAYKKLIELFPDAHIPKLSKLKTELEKARTDYAQQSAERKALKKEADRLSRLAQQKRDSQRTLARYMQNEQAAKRKKSQLE